MCKGNNVLKKVNWQKYWNCRKDEETKVLEEGNGQYSSETVVEVESKLLRDCGLRLLSPRSMLLEYEYH